MRLRSLLTVWLLATAMAARAAEPAAAPAPRGEQCLFLGHSFFAPIAQSFAALPAGYGYTAHRQTVVFHGGENGAPGKLWASETPDVKAAKALLATGKVSVVGLTYYPEVGSELADYRRWVDLALAHNPRTRFVIQAPWARYQNRSRADYEAACARGLAAVQGIIEQLRAAYPQTSFRCIPQGRWMAGLWRLYDDGKLPEIKVIKRAQRTDPAPCLFMDNLGHGGDLPVRYGALLWLAAVYDLDPTKSDLKLATQADLKALARELMQDDARPATPQLPPAAP